MDLIHNAHALLADIAGLSLFSSLRSSRLLGATEELLEFSLGFEAGDREKTRTLLRRWASFLEAYINTREGASYYNKIAALVLRDENPFTRAAEGQSFDEIDPLLKALAGTELGRLYRIASLDVPSMGYSIGKILRAAGFGDSAAGIEADSEALRAAEGASGEGVSAEGVSGKEHGAGMFPRDRDWGTGLPAFAQYIRKNGAGDMGRFHCFFWEERRLKGVENPDPILPERLYGYDEQRGVAVTNTLRFLEGKPANNLLLYGDRGTGKSVTVKAVCNAYAGRGLRLIEVRKKDLLELPLLLDILSVRALRFVLFIDDLSFEETGDSFTALKALLEGGVETMPPNVVIYATSNRRHLVKERFSDRPAYAAAPEATSSGDVRAFDTMQEKLSLADRFGVSVVFTSPSQDEFLMIAERIGEERGLLKKPMEQDRGTEYEDERRRFRENALRWERWFNGRSPRTAVQYADWLAGGEGFPWENPAP